MNLRLLWDDLARDAARIKSPNTLCKRIGPHTSADLFAGITSSGARALLLQLPTQSLKTPLFRARGLHLASITMPEQMGKAHYWQLTLAHEIYFDLFLFVVSDLVSALSGVVDKKLVPSVFIQRISVWQEFLAKYGPLGLNENEQRGLIGELWFLKTRVLEKISPANALVSWKGPLKRPRDFQFADAAVEVKTTTGKQHVVLGIANEYQLDDAGLRSLVICHIPMFPVEASGASLPELVADLRSIFIQKGSSGEFDAKLRGCGYMDVHSELYRESRFRIEDEQYYRVSAGFPRILAKDLLPGVGDIRYSVAVAALQPFKTTAKKALAYFND